MRDLVFAGSDVAEALAAASRALDLPVERLRYVVLEPGRPERLGVKAQPARVAVLLETPRGDAGPTRTVASPVAATVPRPAALVTAFALAANLELEAEEEVGGEDERVLRLRGAGARILLEDGSGDLLPALEHLLQKAAQEPGRSRLRIECEGYREWREARVREQARELVAAVQEDGRARRTPPLNSYERRLVHLAVAEVPGLRSHSEGEGPARLVVIAPDGDSEPPSGGGTPA